MRSVFLVASSTLFGRGLEKMLRQEPGLEVWGCETDLSRAVERVVTLKPDVVIVERRQHATDLGDALRQMLRACEHIQVIELNCEDDTICIYSGQRQVMREAGDLMEAIEQSAAP